jgi:hypothetical protein
MTMTFKNSIRLYEFLDKLHLAGIFLIVIAVILVVTKDDYNFILFGVGVATVLLKLFRKDIFYATLQKTKYKSAFISVTDKISEYRINETFRSDFSFYQNLPADYSTEDFIKDNSLKTIVEYKWDNAPFLTFSNKELEIGDKNISWTDVIDWHYYHGHSGGAVVPTRIEIEHRQNGSDKTLKEYIQPDKLNASHIDILLLLYHFKNTSG